MHKATVSSGSQPNRLRAYMQSAGLTHGRMKISCDRATRVVRRHRLPMATHLVGPDPAA